MIKVINAGAFRYKIGIYSVDVDKDAAGFAKPKETLLLKAYAQVKAIRGYTMIVNNSDFEKAFTNFTIRKPRVAIERGMIIKHLDKHFEIQYINPLGIAGELLEMQAKETAK